MELDSEADQITKNREKAGLVERLTKGLERLIHQSEYVNEYRKMAPHEGPLLEANSIQNTALDDLFRKESLRDLGLPKEFDAKTRRELSKFVDYLHKNYPEALTVWVKKTNEGSADDPRIIAISQLAQKVLKNVA